MVCIPVRNGRNLTLQLYYTDVALFRKPDAGLPYKLRGDIRRQWSDGACSLCEPSSS